MSGLSQGFSHLGDILGTALVYTVLGMGVVFCMLIFISIVISQFIHINRLVMRRKAKEQEQPTQPEFPALMKDTQEEPDDTDEEEEMADDRELAAVIAAAIAAYTDMPADGFIVRSIRRSSANHWR